MDRDELKKVLQEALDEWMHIREPRMAAKWHGGKLELKPELESQKSREIDIEVFFHKIVMVRESLRVLEQKINNHPKLDDADRIEMQKYITKVYGSLTTFNILFADEEDRFVGQRGE